MNYIHASLVISNQSIFVKYLVVHHYSKCTKCKVFFNFSFFCKQLFWQKGDNKWLIEDWEIIARLGLNQDIKTGNCGFQCAIPHQWIAQWQVSNVSEVCDRWHFSVAAQWSKYHCYKQAPSRYDLKCLKATLNPNKQRKQNLLLTWSDAGGSPCWSADSTSSSSSSFSCLISFVIFFLFFRPRGALRSSSVELSAEPSVIADISSSFICWVLLFFFPY